MEPIEINTFFCKQIADILHCNPNQIIVSRKEKDSIMYRQVTHYDYDKDEFHYDFSIGSFRIDKIDFELPSKPEFSINIGLTKHQSIGSFELYQMPHCCGILVSTKAWIDGRYRSMNLGNIFHEMRLEIAKRLGYSLILCTDLINNKPQNAILKRHNWKNIAQFVNKRTKNEIAISIKYLN